MEAVATGHTRVPDSCLPYRGRRRLSAEHQSWCRELSGVVRHCPDRRNDADGLGFRVFGIVRNFCPAGPILGQARMSKGAVGQRSSVRIPSHNSGLSVGVPPLTLTLRYTRARDFPKFRRSLPNLQNSQNISGNSGLKTARCCACEHSLSMSPDHAAKALEPGAAMCRSKHA